MKTSLLCQLGTSVLLAAAQPGLHRRHSDIHNKRGITHTVTEVETEVVYVTTFVDAGSEQLAGTQQKDAEADALGRGRYWGSSGNHHWDQGNHGPWDGPPQTHNNAEPTAPAAVPTHSSAPPQAPAPAPTSATQANPPPNPAPSAPAQSPPPQQPQPSPSGGGSSPGNGGAVTSGLGIVYSPYLLPKGGENCRDIAADMTQIMNDPRGFSYIRIYAASDCQDMLSRVGKAIRDANSKMKIVLSPTNNAAKADLDQLTVKWASYLDLIDTVLVCNEGTCGTSAEVAAMITQYKGQYGSGIKVSAAFQNTGQPIDTAVTAVADICVVNIYANYDQNADPGNAGPDVGSKVADQGCPSGMPFMVGESGWPSAGGAKYTPDFQKQAIDSLVPIVGSYGIDSLMLFMAFNDPTKDGVDECSYGFLD